LYWGILGGWTEYHRKTCPLDVDNLFQKMEIKAH